MMQLYKDTCFECSKLITNKYSTSFSLGIKMLDKKLHDPIYAIYGFVRFADEIVDTFHEHDKADLLQRFKLDAYTAIEEKISLNPVLQAFQAVVRQYHIEHELIDAFLYSMEMDLDEQVYTTDLLDTYIYGSAEVVGLMCLRVFCEGDKTLYDSLKDSARSLGAAFQKVNFLRDMKSDFDDRGRIYFPNISFSKFDAQAKQLIEEDIKADFEQAYAGIQRLPDGAKFGVYTAYRYYLALFDKIRQAQPSDVLKERIRVPNPQKFFLLFRSLVKNQLNLI